MHFDVGEDNLGNPYWGCQYSGNRQPGQFCCQMQSEKANFILWEERGLRPCHIYLSSTQKDTKDVVQLAHKSQETIAFLITLQARCRRLKERLLYPSVWFLPAGLRKDHVETTGLLPGW